MVAILVMAVILPMMLATAFLLGRHFQRRKTAQLQLSLVSRQHIDLFQGGQLNQAQVDAAKSHFRHLLERGEVSAVEASLRPGIQYVVQVRALSEIGTEDAGLILERQLQRQLSQDHLEQAWYWIDLAHGLRNLNREQSLPRLLRCAEKANNVPLSHFFSAETICFLGFSGFLDQPDSHEGYTALRVLHRALEGLRHGLPPLVIADGRVGELIERLWDNRSDVPHPMVVRIFLEVQRLLRRSPHIRLLMPTDGGDLETFDWQMSRLAVLEPGMSKYIKDVAPILHKRLPNLQDRYLEDALYALLEMRSETGPELIQMIEKGQELPLELAVECLTWSKSALTGQWLRDQILDYFAQTRSAHWRQAFWPWLKRRSQWDFPYNIVLYALRGHPSFETEFSLLHAARDRDPSIRAYAVSSLGWWEPIQRQETLECLQQARRDGSAEVRQSARAALARLGERQSLQWFRQALTSEELHHIHEAIQIIAAEGLTLLWPDLDHLTEADNADVAHFAREAAERLFEEMERNSRA